PVALLPRRPAAPPPLLNPINRPFGRLIVLRDIERLEDVSNRLWAASGRVWASGRVAASGRVRASERVWASGAGGAQRKPCGTSTRRGPNDSPPWPSLADSIQHISGDGPPAGRAKEES